MPRRGLGICNSASIPAAETSRSYSNSARTLCVSRRPWRAANSPVSQRRVAEHPYPAPASARHSRDPTHTHAGRALFDRHAVRTTAVAASMTPVAGNCSARTPRVRCSRISSALNRPLTVSASALSYESPTVPVAGRSRRGCARTAYWPSCLVRSTTSMGGSTSADVESAGERQGHGAARRRQEEIHVIDGVAGTR
jgi:hypothetical protein